MIAKKINIQNNEWIIEKPIITKDNISTQTDDVLELKTNFNYEKINKLFSNISTLNLLQLFDLKNDPWETTNLAYRSSHQDDCNRMAAEIDRLEQTLDNVDLPDALMRRA